MEMIQSAFCRRKLRVATDSLSRALHSRHSRSSRRTNASLQQIGTSLRQRCPNNVGLYHSRSFEEPLKLFLVRRRVSSSACFSSSASSAFIKESTIGQELVDEAAARSSSSTTTTKMDPWTLEQERAAVLELEGMIQLAERLLNDIGAVEWGRHLKEQHTSVVKDLRRAVEYWLGNASTAAALASDNQYDPEELENDNNFASRLLDLVTHEYKRGNLDLEDLHHIFDTFPHPDGLMSHMPWGVLILGINKYLTPFSSTTHLSRLSPYGEIVVKNMAKASNGTTMISSSPSHQSPTKLRRATTSRNLPIGGYQVLVDALKRASKVAETLEYILRQSTDEATPHHAVITTLLRLWLHRSWFIDRFQGDRRISLEDQLVALAGARSIQECSEAMDGLVQLASPETRQAHLLSFYMPLITVQTQSATTDTLNRAKELLQQLLEESSIHDTIDIAPYNAILYGYALLAHKDRMYGQGAVEYFEEIEDLPNVFPDEITYATVLLALKNSGNATQAVNFLQQLFAMSVNDIDRVLPNNIACNVVLDALSKSKQWNAAQKTEEFYQWMNDMAQQHESLTPDHISFTSVLAAWARSSCREGAERADRLLHERIEKAMSDDKSSGDDASLSVDVIMYNHVLMGWSLASERIASCPDHTSQDAMKAAERADTILQQMKESDLVQPDRTSYNYVLSAWDKSRIGHVAIDRSLALLEELKERATETGQSDLFPDRFAYNSVLRTIAMNRTLDEAFEFMEKNTEEDGFRKSTVSYNILLDAMVAKGQTLEATQLFEEMKHGPVKPDEVSYNTVINGCAKEGTIYSAEQAEAYLRELLSQPHLSATLVPYTTVMDAYAKTRTRLGVQKNEMFLQMIKDSPTLRPNAVAYNTVMNALAKSDHPNAPERAEELLNEMQASFDAGNTDIHIGSFSFSTVINCWAQSGREEAAARAEAILERMENLADSGLEQYRPTAFSYSSVLNAWSKHPGGGADQAIALLDRMEENCRKYPSTKNQPTVFSYNSTINALAKNPNRPTKAVEARNILDRMLEAVAAGNIKAMPIDSTYSTVLNACAFIGLSADETSKEEAFKIAKRTLSEYLTNSSSAGADEAAPERSVDDQQVASSSTTKQQNNPILRHNVVVFATFLTCCSNLLPPGPVRDKIAAATFLECIKHKTVNSRLIRSLEGTVSSGQFQSLMVRLGHEHPAYTTRRTTSKTHNNANTRRFVGRN